MNKKYKIKISPYDTLYFGNGMTFSMGEDNFAGSVMLPSPGVLYGFLRGWYFSNNMDDYDMFENNKGDATRNLKIEAVYLSNDLEILLPAPVNVVESIDKDYYEKIQEDILCAGKIVKPVKINKDVITSKRKYEYIFLPDDKVENVEGAFLDDIEYSELLYGKHGSDIYYRVLSDLAVTEHKTGIGRNKETKTTDDGLLYNAKMSRLKDNIEINVIFSGIDAQTGEGSMRMGGEGKYVKYCVEETDEHPYNVIYQNLSETEFISVYLITPAIFENGFSPQEKKGFELVGFCNGKRETVAGFDVKLKKPKPQYNTVPAGSIYLYKITGENIDYQKIKETFANVSDYRGKEGYGLTMIGRGQL